ncbi:MAG: hypothetical protein K8R40_11610 [Anaerolineaceae bacterium]|nr:hypothetical protein [Anaerolineaceae bacterium]
MAKSTFVLRKILLIFSLLSILMCPLLYIAGEFFTNSLSFLEPVVCPSGMQLGRTTESISNPQGNATASYMVCTDGNEEVNVTGKMLVILFGVAILGLVLLVTWALTGPSKKPDVPKFKME